MEYGSEFDLGANEAFRGGSGIPADWQLFRSGRDALKAFARLAGKRRVLLPALCCESMILPFRLNGCDVAFYRLKADYSADAADVSAKLRDGDVLLYMRYFGIRPFRDAFLRELRESGRDILFLEDRTHDILVPREEGGFRPDAAAASLRKWAALPEGGMLETALGTVPAPADPRYGDLRREAMEMKRNYLESGDEGLHSRYMAMLRTAEGLLDRSPEPVGMHPRHRETLEALDFAGILAARRRNLTRLREDLAPLIDAGTLRLMTASPERSGLYLPVLVSKRDEVQRELIARKLYCPAAIWPEPAAAAGVCPVSHAVTRSMLSLLCDQRYSEADMDYEAANVAEIVLKNARA